MSKLPIWGDASPPLAASRSPEVLLKRQIAVLYRPVSDYVGLGRPRDFVFNRIQEQVHGPHFRAMVSTGGNFFLPPPGHLAKSVTFLVVTTEGWEY